MEWRKGKLIGRGSSADVSLGRDCRTGDVFAVKHTTLSRASALQKEEEIHSTLNCDQIIEYKGNDITLEKGHFVYNVLLEYAPHGTLIDTIRSKGSGLSEASVRGYTREIVKGLEYLHSRGIVHCDIKGANILVTNDGVKIGDFGCSRRVDDAAVVCLSSVEVIAGTPMYMAPEVARGEEQGYRADVWALGCTVLEMATGLPPWPNISQDPVSALYWIGFIGTLPKIPGYLTDQAKDFLDKCLNRDPRERWSATQLLNHPFLNDDGFIHKLSLETPTSVLDPNVWEKIENPDSSPGNSTHEGNLKSTKDRMRELAGDTSTESSFDLMDDDDGAWITVRSKNNDETETFFSTSGQPSTGITYTNLTKPKVQTIVEGFTSKCMQMHSSLCFILSRNLFKHLRILKLLEAITWQPNYKKVLPKMFVIDCFVSDKFISNFQSALLYDNCART